MRLQGLYLLADEQALPFAAWAELMPEVLDAGVRLVQYRAKLQTPGARHDHAACLLAWCRERNLPLLINDDPELCAELGADGVHLGRDDAAIRAARRRLGPEALIGASCYDALGRARAAIDASADYVSFGRLFASTTKPQATATSLDVLSQARAQLGAPICAIGGINPHNAAQVIEAGADLLCVAGGILGADDPVAATRKLARIGAASPSESS